MESAATPIEVRVNGAPRQIAPGTSVAGLLDRLGLHPGLVVVEHNGRIVARARLGETPLHEGDVVEIVHFVGGG